MAQSDNIASNPERRGWWASGATPDRLRVLAIGTVLVLLVAGATAWVFADRLVNRTTEVAQSTGEVLIATQQVTASFAEADAAAVSVHLAGADGNREQRRLYELAIDRATTSLERVASLVGNDDSSHDALADVAARTTTYVGLIEAARLASVEELARADGLLTEASAVNRDEISPDVQLVADRARARFNDQTSSGWFIVALVGLVVAVIVLTLAHRQLSQRFRRRLNVPVALAWLLMLVLLLAAGRGYLLQQQAFDDAQEDAYDAILVSQQIQENAYLHRAIGTASVLADTPATTDLIPLEKVLDSERSLFLQALNTADSPREVAMANEMITRWNRYITQSIAVQTALEQGDTELAESITQGPANAAFNGFNTSVEAALLDNREQFLGQLQQASDSLRWMRGMILLGTLLAGLLTWWGFAQRIGEYR